MIFESILFSVNRIFSQSYFFNSFRQKYLNFKMFSKNLIFVLILCYKNFLENYTPVRSCKYHHALCSFGRQREGKIFLALITSKMTLFLCFNESRNKIMNLKLILPAQNMKLPNAKQKLANKKSQNKIRKIKYRKCITNKSSQNIKHRKQQFPTKFDVILSNLRF